MTDLEKKWQNQQSNTNVIFVIMAICLITLSIGVIYG